MVRLVVPGPRSGALLALRRVFEGIHRIDDSLAAGRDRRGHLPRCGTGNALRARACGFLLETLDPALVHRGGGVTKDKPWRWVVDDDVPELIPLELLIKGLDPMTTELAKGHLNSG